MAARLVTHLRPGTQEVCHADGAALPWAGAVLGARQEFIRTARAFWLIPELLPQPALDDVAVLHAFCRHLDDAVDEAATPQEAARALATWRDEVEGRAPPRPLVAAFLHRAPRAGIPLDCARLLLEGMEWDLGTVRLADDEALLRYSYRVSSCVGLLLAPLLGVHRPQALHRVVDLGIGLQVSNILLGVAADARRGRVYLPASRLAVSGLTPEWVLENPGHPALTPVMSGLARLGDSYYRSAADGAAEVPLRYRHGVLLLARVYGALGWKSARGEAAPSTPLGLSWRERLQHLLLLLVVGLQPRVLGLSAPPPHDARLHQALAGLPGTHGGAP